MMRVVRWIGKILKYAAGVLCWLIIFGYLGYACVFDAYSVIDSLWMKNLHDDLVENAIGEVALHVNCGRCVDLYLYTVRYNPNRMDAKGELKSLTSLVDVRTWREVESDSVTVTYVDSKHRYRLYIFEGSEYILTEDSEQGFRSFAKRSIQFPGIRIQDAAPVLPFYLCEQVFIKGWRLVQRLYNLPDSVMSDSACARIPPTATVTGPHEAA